MKTPSNCGEIVPLLDDYLDGGLDDLRVRAVRAHLRNCIACSARVDTTEQLVGAASSLREIDPPPALWARVTEVLDADDTELAARPRWWWWWQTARSYLFVGAGALAAAAVLLLFLSGGVGAQRSLPLAAATYVAPAPERLYEEALAEVARAEADYQTAVRELRELASKERPRWRAEVQHAFDENLAVIDAAVARQVELWRSQPGNVAMNDALAASYRKEIDFLQEAVLRGEMQE